MAQVMRHGKTPLWGVYDLDMKPLNLGIILDSYNYSVEVKDYEQLDEAGRVVGYMAYDLTVNFDISGTILHAGLINEETNGTYPPCVVNFLVNCNKGVGNTVEQVAIHNALGGVNTKITKPSTAIVKSYSVNTSQGSAATFSLSGTIYDFPSEI